jgi:hypothetical protein
MDRSQRRRQHTQKSLPPKPRLQSPSQEHLRPVVRHLIRSERPVLHLLRLPLLVVHRWIRSEQPVRLPPLHLRPVDLLWIKSAQQVPSLPLPRRQYLPPVVHRSTKSARPPNRLPLLWKSQQLLSPKRLPLRHQSRLLQ